MALQVIPLQPLPSQNLSILLGGQPCTITLRQLDEAMFLDLYVNDVLIIGGVICENRNPIVRSVYLGFVGDLAFNDTQGSDDPVYAGLGSRFVLFYVTPGPPQIAPGLA